MKKLYISLIGLSLVIFAIVVANVAKPSGMTAEQQELAESEELYSIPQDAALATFGSGCFWCLEAVLQETAGVYEVISGYGGGDLVNPTYEQVYTMQTNHRESVQVYYDESQISYSEVLDIFWRSIDPTDPNGQFVDQGFSYTAAIFFHNDTQQEIAQSSKQALANSDRFSAPIVTPIIPFTTFYQAEEYHQDFYQKSTQRYTSYESNSGRNEYKAAIWQEIQGQN